MPEAQHWNNLYFLIKSLGYFADCEDDTLPQMIEPVAWEQVKEFLINASIRLAKKHL